MKMKLDKELGSAERGGRTQALALQQLLDKFVSADALVHNGVLLVETPNFVWAGASGFSNPDVKLPMRAEDQFQPASITKMFTASALMTLVEKASSTSTRESVATCRLP